MRKALVILGELSDGDMDWIAQAGRSHVVPPGTPIIVEQQAVESLFIILDGLAAVTVRGVEVARLAAGEILGEMSLLETRLPTASVTPEVATTLLAVSHADLRRKLKADVGFGCRFYHALAVLLAQRLRQTTISSIGYGRTEATDRQGDDADEIDVGILDHVHLAGAKFDKLLKLTMKAG
jgi:CRP/FNR family cyclic AMP-dependent transcriptional regulator